MVASCEPSPHLQVYSVKVVVHTEQVLAQLLQREEFTVARKYASIVNSTVSQVTVKEVSVVYCVCTLVSVIIGRLMYV